MGGKIADLDVSRETVDRLHAFADLTRKWTPRINLIAKGTVNEIWDRHIVDSAQLFSFAPDDFHHWVDLGSGGGFPGVVMAVIAAEKVPDARFTLIESDQRKATFLRTAIRELDLSATVLAERIESAPPQKGDVVSARALASLDALMPLIRRHLSDDGICLLHKGRQAAQEIADASQSWVFDLEERPSLTDPEARLLAIKRILPRGQ